MNILWMTNYPSPYRVDFFNELGKYCDLSVIFENSIEQQTHRNKDWFISDYNQFQAIFLKQNRKIEMIRQAMSYIRDKSYDFVVLGDYSTPVSVGVALRMSVQHIKYAISIDGAYLRKSNFIKDIVKKTIIRNAVFCLSSSESSDEYLIHYGALKNNIHRYNFTSLRKSDIMQMPISSEEKENIRNALQMDNKLTALIVGRFVYIKGIDFILHHAKKYQRIMDFYIAGDKVTDECLSIVEEEKIDNVHFIGFQKKDELKRYYKACDLFIFPTRYDPWGLVINEAMANAMPILSSDKSSAALHFIKNGENGFVYHADNDAEFDHYLMLLCQNQNRLLEMGVCNLNKIQEYSIEKMALQHRLIFENYFKTNI